MSYAKLVLALSCVIILSGCGGGGDMGVSPGMTFDPPSTAAVMLPAPTYYEQVQQPLGKPWCADCAGLTLYRVITKKYDKDLLQVVREMHTDANGTCLSDIVNWLNDNGMAASMTTIPKANAINWIREQTRNGSYTIPYVNENGVPKSPHALVLYGVDDGRILMSDSNRHAGMNRIAVKTEIFERNWLINTGTELDPTAILIFVNKNPVRRNAPQKQATAGAAEMFNGNLRVR